MLPSGINIRIREDLIDGSSRTQTTLIIDPIITKGGHRVTMADIGDIGYGKINQGNSNEELISWTGITDNTSTYTLTGCTWGLNFHNLSADVNNRKRHTSGNKFSINTDMHFIAKQFVSKDDGIVESNNLYLGDGLGSNKTIFAQNADANKPFVRYDETLNKWIISNDGVNSYDPEAGGSGVTAGDGVSIVGGEVSVNRLDTTTFVETSAGAGDDNKVPILSADGKLDQSFIDLADYYTWTGEHNFNGTTNISNLVLTGDVTGLTSIKKILTAGEAISARDVVSLKWTAVNAGAYSGDVTMTLAGKSTGGGNVTQDGNCVVGYDGANFYSAYLKPSTPIQGSSFKFKLYRSSGSGSATFYVQMRLITGPIIIGSPPPATGATITNISLTNSGNAYTEYTISSLTFDQVQSINAYGFALVFVSGVNILIFNDVTSGSNKPLANPYVGTDFTEKIFKASSTDITLGNVVGIAESAINLNATGLVIVTGIVSGFTGLTPGFRYKLGASGAIQIDTTLYGTLGSLLTSVGVAISDTELLLKIN